MQRGQEPDVPEPSVPIPPLEQDAGAEAYPPFVRKERDEGDAPYPLLNPIEDTYYGQHRYSEGQQHILPNEGSCFHEPVDEKANLWVYKPTHPQAATKSTSAGIQPWDSFRLLGRCRERRQWKTAAPARPQTISLLQTAAPRAETTLQRNHHQQQRHLRP